MNTRTPQSLEASIALLLLPLKLIFLFLKKLFFLNLSEHIQVVRNITGDFQSEKGCQGKQKCGKYMPKSLKPGSLHSFPALWEVTRSMAKSLVFCQ